MNQYVTGAVIKRLREKNEYYVQIEHDMTKQHYISFIAAVSADRKVLLRTGYVHIAFSVGSRASVDTLTERLKGDEYQVVSGPRTTGDGYYESCITLQNTCSTQEKSKKAGKYGQF